MGDEGVEGLALRMLGGGWRGGGERDCCCYERSDGAE